jgi:hypothetical protein
LVGISPALSSALQGSCERERHEHRHCVGVVLDDLGEPGGWRDRLAVFGHAFDMQGERLPRPRERFIEAARGGDGEACLSPLVTDRAMEACYHPSIA